VENSGNDNVLSCSYVRVLDNSISLDEILKNLAVSPSCSLHVQEGEGGYHRGVKDTMRLQAWEWRGMAKREL
jgi:hypothetical protein